VASERLNVALIGATDKVVAPAHLNGLCGCKGRQVRLLRETDDPLTSRSERYRRGSP